MFSCFSIFFLLLMWFAFVRYRVTRKEASREKLFWQKEEQANAVRRKDLSGLAYLKVPVDLLPFGTVPGDSTLADYEARALALSEKKILNLEGRTNTDLKLAYGAPNLTFLTECDQNFVSLVRLLQQWGLRLYELSHPAEAALVLEEAVRIGSDIKGTYLLLARIYSESGQTGQLEELKKYAGQLNSLMKEPILSQLEQF